MHKNKTILFLACILLALPASSQPSSNALSVRWSADIGGVSEKVKSNIIFIGASDINNDKFDEVIVVSGGSITSSIQPPTNFVYVFTRNGTILWKRAIDDEITSAYVKDIDRDGFQEILLSAGQLREEISRGRIYVLTDEGETTRTLHSTSIVLSMYITDLDGDKIEDIIGGSSLRVRVFDSYGLSKWKEDGYLIGNAVNVLYAGDILGDELKEVLAGSDSLYVFDSLGNLLSSISAYNLSGEKNDEIASINLIHTSRDSHPYVLVTTKEGSTINALKVEYKSSASAYQLRSLWEYDFDEKISSIKVADINSDTQDDILVGTQDDYITVLDDGGGVLWAFKANGDVMDEDVSDVNSDGKKEVLFGTISGTIYVLSIDKGEFMWRYDVNEPISKVQVADFEGDPYKEVIVGSMTRILYVFEVNQTFTDFQMAENLYLKAQELYIISEYNLSLDYLKKAQGLYTKVNDSMGIRKTQEVIKSINEKISGLEALQANVDYDKAQEFFIEGDYQQAEVYAKRAKAVYDKFRDTQNSIKVELLLLRIEKMIGEDVESTTTIVVKTGASNKPDLKRGNAYITLTIAFIVLVVGLYIRKRRSSSKAMEEYMTGYEKDLEKVIEEDLSDLKDMRARGE